MDTKQISMIVKSFILENKAICIGGILLIAGSGLILAGITVFISLLSLILLKLDLLTSMLIGFFTVGIIACSVGGYLIAKKPKI